MQVQQPNLNKRNENKNNDNSTLKKINWPFALPGRPPSHPAGDRHVQRDASSATARQTQKQTYHSLKLALALVHVDHITGRIVNANHGIV
jgi:hypothetical protein